MEKRIITTTFIVILTLFTFINVVPATKVINVSDFSFTPQNEFAETGDTIKWVWVSGFHTTTSSTIPAGATSWDALIDPSHTSYIYVVQIQGTYNYVCTPHAGMGMTGTIIVTPKTGIKEISGPANTFALSQNYPNPFNPATQIRFSVPSAAFVNLSVFDLSGRKVAELVNGTNPAGEFLVDFNATGLSSGVYFYRLTAGNFTEVKKMTLLK
jgi:plastocyanin